MQLAAEAPPFFLVLTGLVGIGICLRLRAGKKGGKTSDPQPQPDASEPTEAITTWADACAQLDEETDQLRLLLGKLEAEFGSYDPSGARSIHAPVEDTTVVDLEGIASLADDLARSIHERRADLEAALESEKPCADWEQESPEMVSLMEALKEIPEPVSAGPIEPDDLKQIRGIGKVLEGVLHERGIQTFQQLASLSLDDIEALSKELKHFGNRVRRDRWVEQAQELVERSAG